MLIYDIIEKKGVNGFLKIEERVNAGLHASRCVIATGGSVCYLPRAMEHLAGIGKIVYLKLDENAIARRIPSFRKRGVVMRGNITDLSGLFAERIPLYEKYAQITGDCNGQTVEETADAIVRAIGLI